MEERVFQVLQLVWPVAQYLLLVLFVCVLVGFCVAWVRGRR